MITSAILLFSYLLSFASVTSLPTTASSAKISVVDSSEKSPLESLPYPAVNHVINHVFLNSKSSISSIARTSKSLHAMIKYAHVGEYSEMGDMIKPMRDPAICRVFYEDPSKRLQVRVAHVTLPVLQECKLYEENYLNLKRLYVFIPANGPSEKQQESSVLGLMPPPVAVAEETPQESNEANEERPAISSTWRVSSLSQELPTDQVALWHALEKVYPNIEELDVINYDGVGVLIKSLFVPSSLDRIKTLQSILSTKKVNVNRENVYRDGHYPFVMRPITFCFAPYVQKHLPDAYFNVKDCVKTFVDYEASLIHPGNYSVLYYAASLPTKDVLAHLVERSDQSIRDWLKLSTWTSIHREYGHPLTAATLIHPGNDMRIPSYLVAAPLPTETTRINTAIRDMFKEAAEKKEMPFFYLLSIMDDLTSDSPSFNIAYNVVSFPIRSDLMLEALMGHPSGEQLVSAKLGSKETLLHRAACFDHEETPVVLTRLIESGWIDKNARGTNGNTALMVAANGGYVASLKAMIEGGIDVSIRDEKGWDALQVAIESSYSGLVVYKLLVDAGVDLMAAYTPRERFFRQRITLEVMMEKILDAFSLPPQQQSTQEVKLLMDSVVERVPSLYGEEDPSAMVVNGFLRMIDVLNLLGDYELLRVAMSKMPRLMHRWYQLVDRGNGRWFVSRTREHMTG